MIELRCPNKKFGELVQPSSDEGRIEVRCASSWCRNGGNGVVIVHTFSTRDGSLLWTDRYREPTSTKERT